MAAIEELTSSPPKLSLSSQQFRNCCRALDVFKNKLQNPQLIEREYYCRWKDDSDPDPMLGGVALDRDNVSKNRYPTIFPYDSTRVVLHSCKDSDYINASFIRSPIEGSPRFIATQGPLDCTIEHFWEMVLENRCPAIVMLTRLFQLVDNKKQMKCDDYFLEKEGPRKFGDISVTTKGTVKSESSLVLRLLEVTKAESEEEPLSVLHIQYPEWPDHGVPEDTFAVREVMKRTYRYSLSPDVGSIVVHCSAGVGRTGAYCVIHDTIQRILAGDKNASNVVETLTGFRSQRGGMVQKVKQYFFCYKAVADELEELISGYKADNRLNSTSRGAMGKMCREPSVETPQEKHPRLQH